MPGETFHGAKHNHVNIGSCLKTLKEKIVKNVYIHCHTQYYRQSTKKTLSSHSFLKFERFNINTKRHVFKIRSISSQEKRVMVANQDIKKKIKTYK